MSRSSRTFWTLAYLMAASLATVYMTAESWHYGFWKTAWSSILTLVAVFFVGISYAAFQQVREGALRSVATVSFLVALIAAMDMGAYFRSPCLAFDSMLSAFSVCLFVVMFTSAVLYFKGGSRIVSLGLRSTKVIRSIVLLAPLPIFAYSALSLYVRSADLPCLPKDVSAPITIAATKTFIAGEKFLFGMPRADTHYRVATSRAFYSGNLSLAEMYARLGLENAQNNVQFHTDWRSLLMLRANELRLGRILLSEKKESGALDVPLLIPPPSESVVETLGNW